MAGGEANESFVVSVGPSSAASLVLAQLVVKCSILSLTRIFYIREEHNNTKETLDA